MNAIFKSNNFAIQVISRGSFLDDDPGFLGKVYQVETATIRLNHVALGEYFNSQPRKSSDDFETEQEYENYLAQCKTRQTDFKNRIATAVGYDPTAGNIAVSKAAIEIFTVVHIRV